MIGLAYMPNASAAKDEFTVKCTEVRDSKPDETPEYTCMIETGLFFPDGPKKPKRPDGKPWPRDKDFVIALDRLVITEPGSSLAAKEGLKPFACPGWWFINGKWIYDSVAPCP